MNVNATTTTRQRSLVRLAPLILLAAIGLMYAGVNAITAPGGNDGAALYYGARLTLLGVDPYDEAAAVREWRRERAPREFKPGMPTRVFLYPPIAAVPLAPTALCPWHRGIPGMAALNFAALIGCLFALPRLTRTQMRAADLMLLTAFVTLNRPLRAMLWDGQNTILFCLLIALALIALRSGRRLLFGALFAVALGKFTLSAPFFIPIAFRRDWRAIGLALGLFLIINGALAARWGQPIGWIGEMRRTVAATVVNGESDVSRPDYTDLTSVDHLVYALIGSKRRSLARPIAALTLLAGSAITLLLLYRLDRTTRPFDNPLELALCAIAALTLFYHRVYDLTALMFVYTALWATRRTPQRAAWISCAAALILSSLLVSYDGRLSFGDSMRSLAPTHQMNSIGTLLLFVAVCALAYRTRSSTAERNGS